MSSRLFSVLVLFFALSGTACASNSQDAARDARTEQAREDYRAYLQELKRLGAQYREITGEISKVIKEEGLPVFDEETGTIEVKTPDQISSSNASSEGFRVREEKDRIEVSLDMPGMDRSTIQVRVQDRKMLRVSAKRKDNGAHYERLVELSSQVKDRGHEARYEDGVLVVKLPKEAVSAQEIQVPVR